MEEMNYSTEDHNYDYSYYEDTASAIMATAITVPIIFAAIFVIGIVGNGTLIYTVLKNKTMRNVPNFYIVSLALGDFLLIAVGVPFTSTMYTFPDWPFGEAVCKFNEFVQTFSLGVSVFTLTALSADRYSAIVNPMAIYTENPTRRTLVITSLIWVLSIALAIPDLVSWHVLIYENDPGEKDNYICFPYPEDKWPVWYPKFHAMFRFCIYFAIPMVIIAVFYVRMAGVLIASSEQIPGEANSGSLGHFQRQMEARRKVAKVVLCFVIIFVVCWLPRHIYLLWYHFDPSEYDEFWHYFKIIGFCLCFVNSCVNPLSLYFLSKQFRTYYQKYLCCYCYPPNRELRRGPDYAMYTTIRRSSTTMTMVRSTSQNSHNAAHHNSTNI